MIYRHRFIVNAPAGRVADFHRRPAGLADITPPPFIVRMENPPEVISEGDEMVFTLWLGPFPMRWLARIEEVSESGFTDRQLIGPYDSWVHRHIFEVLAGGRTAVVDEICLRLSRKPPAFLAGLGMAAGLPVLFAYRAWKTRRLLE